MIFACLVTGGTSDVVFTAAGVFHRFRRCRAVSRELGDAVDVQSASTEEEQCCLEFFNPLSLVGGQHNLAHTQGMVLTRPKTFPEHMDYLPFHL